MRSVDPGDLPTDEGVRQAVARFVEELRREAGGQAGRVVLYGSMARGEGTEGSDVDLLVEWGGSLQEALHTITPIATRILLEDGVDLSVQPVTAEERQRMRAANTVFHRNVQREGLVVSG